MPAKKNKPAAKSQPTLEATLKTTRLRVFELLAKHPNGLTMPQIKEKLELKRPVALVKHESLADKPRMKREKQEGVRSMVYSLTTAGKKAITDGTVDSDAPESSAGYTDKE